MSHAALIKHMFPKLFSLPAAWNRTATLYCRERIQNEFFSSFYSNNYKYSGQKI